MSGVGFGAGAWGGSPWGGAPDVLVVAATLAARENLIQIEFSIPIYFSGILDTKDGSDSSKYSVTTVPGTVGMDSSPVRPVNVLKVELTPVDVGYGRFVDVWLDRPMTPHPASYRLSVDGIWSSDGIDPLAPTTSQVPAVFKQLVVPTLDVGMATKDVSGIVPIDPYDPLNLGHINDDGTGDYAVDDGQSPYKTRLLRRGVTIPGGFLHLGEGYGVGITRYGKKLAQASTISRLATEYEQQIAKEPETAKAIVRGQLDPTGKPIVRFIILAKTKSGQTSKFVVPFQAK